MFEIDYETPENWECGDGWKEIITNCLKKLKELDPEVCIMQVKEKFGGLRVYICSGTDEMYAVIDEAEKLADKTCEFCGENKTAKSRDLPWIRTLCDECYKEVKARQK